MPAPPAPPASGWRADAARIDWQRPWLAPFDASAQALHAALRALPAGGSVADALQRASLTVPVAPDLRPMRFVPACALPRGQAYEAFIHAEGAIPTRDNLHDGFNGLVWLRLPRAKRRMNALQAQALAQDGVGAVRGPLRDALTVLDENGAVLHAPPALWQALVARDWRRLFVDLRPLWQDARLFLLGHALLEKLVQPRKPITAHVLCLPGAPADGAALDGWLAGALQPEALAGKPFCPLPVLGVPGWWPGNQDFSFYDDPAVFRGPGPAGEGAGRAPVAGRVVPPA